MSKKYKNLKSTFYNEVKKYKNIWLNLSKRLIKKLINKTIIKTNQQ